MNLDGLITAREMADMEGITIHAVYARLRKRNIAPVATRGALRFYKCVALEEIRKPLPLGRRKKDKSKALADDVFGGPA